MIAALFVGAALLGAALLGAALLGVAYLPLRADPVGRSLSVAIFKRAHFGESTRTHS